MAKAQGRANKAHKRNKAGYNGKYSRGGARKTGVHSLSKCRNPSGKKF